MNPGSVPSPDQPQSGQTWFPHGDTPTSGLRTGGLSTGGLHPKGLPAPSFPEVGRIPKTPFEISTRPIPQRKFTTSTCPLGRTYTKDGNIVLQGGVVQGGSGSITIEDTTIGSVGSPPADGTQVWIEVSYTATTDDDVLLPGGDVTAGSIATGTSVPANDMPTAAAPTGTLYVPLGDFFNDTFRPAGCGNLQIAHCPGSLTYLRG